MQILNVFLFNILSAFPFIFVCCFFFRFDSEHVNPVELQVNKQQKQYILIINTCENLLKKNLFI